MRGGAGAGCGPAESSTLSPDGTRRDLALPPGRSQVEVRCDVRTPDCALSVDGALEAPGAPDVVLTAPLVLCGVRAGGAVRRFPAEFEALLSPAGRRVLAGREPALCGALATGRTRFVAAEGLLDGGRARAVAPLLEGALGEHLEHLEERIPRRTITGMRVAYRERLPKTVSVRTAMLDGRRTRARERAEDIGLVAMLRSPSFHAFAQALSGYPLRRRWGLQALCYRPGDYAGPHNDHHPDEPEARDGYTDLHLSFCTAGVAQQVLVYERGGHFSEVQDVATVGGVTCYRLPFWHYTTPLVARPGREAQARRWVLLGTFIDRIER